MNINYESVVDSRGFTYINEYTISPVDRAQISFKHNSTIRKEENSPGWKIHISIQDENDEAIRVAFNRIVLVMIKHGVAMAKFLKTTCLVTSAPALEPLKRSDFRQGRVKNLFLNRSLRW